MPKMTDSPRVTVVIPAYNRASLLPRAVTSVLAQTYEDYELIIVDDGPTDDTAEVIQSFEDPRIRTVRHADNKGQSAAQNTGIRLARGEYVAFLDDDDEWLAEKLLRQVRTLDASGPRVGLIYTWFDHVDTPSGVRRAGGRSVTTGDASEDVLECRVPAPTSTYLVRTEAARGIGGFDEALKKATDLDFLTRLSEQWHVDVVREVLVVMHGGHRRSPERPGAAESLAGYLTRHILRFDRELAERPSTFARLLRLLAIAEMRRGNVRGAAAAYSKALTVAPLGSLRATVGNVGFIGGLLWGYVGRARWWTLGRRSVR